MAPEVAGMQLQTDKFVQVFKIGPFTVKGVSNKIPKISQVCYLCSFLDSQLDRGFSHTGMRSFPSHIHGFAPFCPVSPPQIETQLSLHPPFLLLMSISLCNCVPEISSLRELVT